MIGGQLVLLAVCLLGIYMSRGPLPPKESIGGFTPALRIGYWIGAVVVLASLVIELVGRAS